MTTSTPQLNASSSIMLDEAKKLGISCHVFDDQETLRMEYGGKAWYTRGSRTSLQSSVGHTIAKLKSLTKAVLTQNNLPTARFVTVNKTEDIARLEQLSFPVVMKPLAGAHGRDVIIGIPSLGEARALFEKKPQPSLFEEELKGTEYRIVCVDFKFVAAAYRKPAFVTGDGEKTIAELVEEKNKHPWRGTSHTNYLTTITLEDQSLALIKEQGLAATSVIEQGQEVFLKKTANLSTGGESENVTDQVSPENAALFEKIAKVCDLSSLGIDIMCQSLATPILSQEKAGVIEVNSSPGLRMHHFPMKGEPINVAESILEMVLRNLDRL